MWNGDGTTLFLKKQQSLFRYGLANGATDSRRVRLRTICVSVAAHNKENDSMKCPNCGSEQSSGIDRAVAPNYSQWNRPTTSYHDVDMFLRWDAFQSGVHSISFGEDLLDMMFIKKRSDTLLVVFNGSSPRGLGAVPPFFSGLGLISRLPCSMLCFSDPALYLDKDITLSWYAGTKRTPFQSIIPAIIDKVASTAAKRVIFLGGSAGGFASLYYATKINTPPVVVTWNPQTNIGKYNPDHIKQFVGVCFGWKEGENLNEAYSSVDSDVCRLYAEGTRPPVIFMQNASDWHVTVHASPFIESFGLCWTGADQTEIGLYLHVGDWGQGHIAPPKALINRIIEHLCSWKGDWKSAVASATPLFALNADIKTLA